MQMKVASVRLIYDAITQPPQGLPAHMWGRERERRHTRIKRGLG